MRQALAYAIDKQQLIDVVQLGLAAPGLSLVLPGHGDAFHGGLQDYGYEPEKAKQLLEDAGYKDSDGDGVREMPGDPSKPLRFRYSYPSDQYAAEGPRFAELLGEMWMQVGVAIDIQAIEADALTAACCPAFDYDVIQWGWSAGPDPSSLLGILTTENITTGVGESGYSNPEYDQFYQEQQVTADRQKRIELFHKLQEIIVRDVPYIIPYYPQKLEAYRSDRFQGWVIDPQGLQTLSSRISLVAISAVQ